MDYKQGGSLMDGLPAGLLIGAGGSMAVTMVLTALMAYFMDKEMIRSEATDVCSVIVLMLSSAAGSLIAWRKVGHHRLMVCLSAGAVYYLALAACTALFFGGEYRNLGITALVILAGAGAVVLLGLREQGSANASHNRKYHYRKLVQNRQRGN